MTSKFIQWRLFMILAVQSFQRNIKLQALSGEALAGVAEVNPPLDFKSELGLVNLHRGELNLLV